MRVCVYIPVYVCNLIVKISMIVKNNFYLAGFAFSCKRKVFLHGCNVLQSLQKMVDVRNRRGNVALASILRINDKKKAKQRCARAQRRVHVVVVTVCVCLCLMGLLVCVCI